MSFRPNVRTSAEWPADNPMTLSRLFHTPKEAEAAFYDAIERADMNALDDVWSKGDNIVCVHPGSPRIEGRRAVMNSFAELFSDAPLLDFSIIDTLQTRHDSLAVHLVREEIAIDGQMISVMVSTNIYQIENGGWRMLLHHASPEPDFALDDDMTLPADDALQQFDAYHFDDHDDDMDDWDTPPPDRPPVLH